MNKLFCVTEKFRDHIYKGTNWQCLTHIRDLIKLAIVVKLCGWPTVMFIPQDNPTI